LATRFRVPCFFRGVRRLPPVRWRAAPPLTYFPKLELSMPLHLLRQLAIIATPILLLAPVPPLRLSAKADDAPKTAHEAAVLDRIFANWKARHDRVRTLHITWDCRTTCKKGTEDFSSTSRPRSLFDRDTVFEQSGVELWLEGDDRMCVVATPNFKVPLIESADRRRVVERWVVVGKVTSVFNSGSWWENSTGPGGEFPRRGQLYRTPTDGSFPISGWQTVLLPFRPAYSSLSWGRQQCRFIQEDVDRDAGHYVELQRLVKPRRFGGALQPGYVETIWVSPARDDLVVRWKTESPSFHTCLGGINYKKDKTNGWIPSEWSCDYVGEQLFEFRVTNYAVNNSIDPAIFSQEFPVGTPVSDQMNGGSAKDVRYYVLEKGGSKRTIPPKEYFRLAGYVDRPAKPPAKPKAN
jgi:hypothetical protein